MAKKNVAADLDNVLDSGFSVDVALDMATGEVLGACEYVAMKKYIWIDALAVKESVQGKGLGSILIKR
jgi:GNAT superfamily N-acetyltransferase